MNEFGLSGRKLAATVLWFVLATAVLAGIGAWLLASKPIWILFGFEIVVAGAALIGLTWIRPKSPEAPGLGLVCLGGSIAASTFLSWLAVRNIPMSFANAGMLLKAWLGFRIAAGALLALIGALAVLRRDERSRGYLIKAVVCGIVFIGVAGVLATGSVRRAIFDLPGWASFAISSVVFLAICVTLSASVHCLVRAFECGITKPQHEQA